MIWIIKIEPLFTVFNPHKYEQYSAFYEIDEKYHRKLCQNFLGNKRKDSMKRHIKECHFYENTKCKICGIEVKWKEEHFDKGKCKINERKNNFNCSNNNHKSIEKTQLKEQNNNILKDNNIYLKKTYFLKVR